MSTPDTEWEKELEEICWRKYGQTFCTLCDGGSSSLIKPLIEELRSSRDTYWKERVKKQRIKQDAITDGAKEWKDGYNQALDTLLDNLK